MGAKVGVGIMLLFLLTLRFASSFSSSPAEWLCEGDLGVCRGLPIDPGKALIDRLGLDRGDTTFRGDVLREVSSISSEDAGFVVLVVLLPSFLPSQSYLASI